MDDSAIVALFFARDSAAIEKAREKHAGYIFSIALHLLPDSRDAEEAVSETWYRAWRSIPPHRPENLRFFLGKLTRDICLNMRRDASAKKRGGNESTLVWEELEDVIPDASSSAPEKEVQAGELAASLERFLGLRSLRERRVFLCRYYYGDSVHEIAERFGITEGSVRTLLWRLRRDLRKWLEKEGWTE